MGVKVKKSTLEITEDATTKPTTISLAQISKGVDKFVRVTPLSPENEDEPPKYSDEAKTIYLQLTSSTLFGFDGFVSYVTLPHALSANRSVCLFLKDEASQNNRTEFIDEMKECGVSGIKVVLSDELESAFNEKNMDNLEEIFKTYDSFVLDKYIGITLASKIAPALGALGKTLDNCSMRKLVQCTAVFLKPSLGCYSVKIGHTGFSKKQLSENIEAAIAKIMSWMQWFPLGLGHFKTVTLKTGTTPGIAIFTNNGEVVPEPPREKRSDAERELRCQKRSAELLLNKQESAKKQKVENLTEASATPATEGKKAKKLRQKQNKQLKKQQAAASPDSSSVQLSTVGKKMKSKKKQQNAAAAIPESSSVQLSTVGKKMKSKKKQQNAAAAIPESSSVQLSTVGKKMKSKKKRQSAAAAI